MIVFLNGILAAKSLYEAFIDVGGVGYAVSMSSTSLSKLPHVGEKVHIITHMVVSDNGIALYGFIDDDEEELFRLMISVSGIGPKTALAALSTMTPKELRYAIVSQDDKTISQIPGIGKKSASRMILELKDKFPSALDYTSDVNMMSSPKAIFGEVQMALSSMGFTDQEIAYALSDADSEWPESVLLQYALKRLAD